MDKSAKSSPLRRAKARSVGRSVGLRAEHVDKNNRVEVKVSNGEYAGERFKVLATPPTAAYFKERSRKGKKEKA